MATTQSTHASPRPNETACDQYSDLPISALASLVELSPVRSNCSYFCTGIRIHKNWILTAAHCVDQADQLLVKPHLGQYASNPIKVDATNIFIHERYYEDYSFHDLALIRLTDTTQPVFGRLDGELQSHFQLDPEAYRLGLSLNSNEPELIKTPIDWVNCKINFDPIAKYTFDKTKLDMVLFKNEKTKVGHSGGPIFVVEQIRGIPTPILLAVHSGTKGGPNGADYGYATAVFSHLDWVKRVMDRFTSEAQIYSSGRSLF